VRRSVGYVTVPNAAARRYPTFAPM
jgi:hypothetical protein